MNKTEQDVIEYIGQDEEPYDRGIQRYDHERRREILAELLAGAPRGRVLDLGCSNGSWYPFFRDQGFAEIHGVELSEHRAEIARARGYQVFVGRGQQTPYPDGHFDAIVNQDVLVHVLQDQDRRDMVREAARVLKPGGTYVLSIAAAGAERLRRRINLFSGYAAASWIKHRIAGQQGRVERIPVTEFNRFWDVGDLQAFLVSLGLTVDAMVGHHFYFGDWSSNFPRLQRRLDMSLGRSCPTRACIVFVQCTKPAAS